MYRFFLVTFLVATIALIASAQDKNASFEFNKDHFVAGSTVVQDSVGVDDLFMAGETVESRQDITGSAHLAGQKVISTGTIDGDAYVAGMDVRLDGKVTGDVTLGGYTLKVGEVDGDLRATGTNITLSKPVSGYALIYGDEVKFESVVKGDVNLRAEDVAFADAARIEGNLIIYEAEDDKIDIPAQVISEDRIERRDVSEWSEAKDDDEAKGWLGKLFRVFKGVLFITVPAAVFAAIRPEKLADLRRSILDHPLRDLLFGFLAISAGLGATILLMVSGLGFRLVLVTFLVTSLAAFYGYVIGAYAIGVKALQMAKRPLPNSLGTNTLAAGAGAILVSLIALIPFLGWIVIFAVTLLGAGSVAMRLFRPKLLVES